MQIYISAKHSIVIFLTFETGKKGKKKQTYLLLMHKNILFYFEKGLKDIVMYVTSGWVNNMIIMSGKKNSRCQAKPNRVF